MSRISLLIGLGFLALAFALPCSAEEPAKAKEVKAGDAKPGEPEKKAEPTDPFAKWEKEVAAMESRDAKEKPAPGGVVFYGSSSIRLWELKKSFPELAAVNHGFGGSKMDDALHFFDRLVPPLKPRLVVLYEGDNDLASGRKPADIASDFKEIVKKLHAALPETRLIVISTKPSPKRWSLFDRQQETNKLIVEAIGDDKLITFIDVTKPMLDSSGNTRPELYRDDKLHMTPAGYEIWAALLAPHLKATSTDASKSQ